MENKHIYKYTKKYRKRQSLGSIMHVIFLLTFIILFFLPSTGDAMKRSFAVPTTFFFLFTLANFKVLFKKHDVALELTQNSFYTNEHNVIFKWEDIKTILIRPDHLTLVFHSTKTAKQYFYWRLSKRYKTKAEIAISLDNIDTSARSVIDETVAYFLNRKKILELPKYIDPLKYKIYNKYEGNFSKLQKSPHGDGSDQNYIDKEDFDLIKEIEANLTSNELEKFRSKVSDDVLNEMKIQ